MSAFHKPFRNTRKPSSTLPPFRVVRTYDWVEGHTVYGGYIFDGSGLAPGLIMTKILLLKELAGGDIQQWPLWVKEAPLAKVMSFVKLVTDEHPFTGFRILEITGERGKSGPLYFELCRKPGAKSGPTGPDGLYVPLFPSLPVEEKKVPAVKGLLF